MSNVTRTRVIGQKFFLSLSLLCMDVILTISQGPVHIKSLSGAGAHNEYELWDEIRGKEDFPQTPRSSNYCLTLMRAVELPEDLRPAECSLIQALKYLSYVWPFAGGGTLELEEKTAANSPRHKTNAGEVEERLLAERGLKVVSVDNSLPISWSATWRGMPLRRAIELWRIAEKEAELMEALRYYNMNAPKQKWNELYKAYENVEAIANGKIKSEWGLGNKCTRFTRTAHSKGVIGDDARHGVQKHSPPPKPMALSDARSLIWTLLDKCLLAKEKAGD